MMNWLSTIGNDNIPPYRNTNPPYRSIGNHEIKNNIPCGKNTNTPPERTRNTNLTQTQHRAHISVMHSIPFVCIARSECSVPDEYITLRTAIRTVCVCMRNMQCNNNDDDKFSARWVAKVTMTLLQWMWVRCILLQYVRLIYIAYVWRLCVCFF